MVNTRRVRLAFIRYRSERERFPYVLYMSHKPQDDGGMTIIARSRRLFPQTVTQYVNL